MACFVQSDNGNFWKGQKKTAFGNMYCICKILFGEHTFQNSIFDEYRKKHYSNFSLKQIIDGSYRHVVEKYGIEGYANNKMYFKDEHYEEFLQTLRKLIENREEFDKQFIITNKLENSMEYANQIAKEMK